MPHRFPRRFFGRVLVSFLVASCTSLSAQRQLQDIPEPDIEAELASFRLDDGLEISLFAADPLVTKPIQMNFDTAGRLWVVSSPLYPHLAPGDEPRDRVLVLEDADGDGRADSSRVFADDLVMPTGIEIGDGGVYVANSHEILWLEDTDRDGVADRRRVVLSGFGTEDTHHLIHTFRWGPDGSLYFNQSIYIHSHVETPWGVRRMDGGGVWRLRTDSLRLEPLLWGMCNPWGHAFDEWGQSLGTDGAGFEGIQFLVPGATCRHSPRPDPILPGLNPGSPKYCSLEIIEGTHFPPEWNGQLITGDFRAQGVCRFELTDDGSGFAAKKLPDVVRSTHVAFRPVDVKVGPDGALYIADWYNPIIQHGEVGFRDPRRNHSNGRIWRITARGRPTHPNPRLDQKDIAALLDELRSVENWNRHFAKRELALRDRDAVRAALTAWLESLDATDARYEHHLLEALWLRETLEDVDTKLLERLLAAREPRARAAAVRVVSNWRERLRDPLSLLAPLVADPFPRVRLEAVRALGQTGDARAAALAAGALDQPLDAFLEYGLALTFRELADEWVPALQRGELDFRSPAELEWALRAVGSSEVTSAIAKILAKSDLPEDRRHALLATLAAAGNPAELDLVFKETLENATSPAQSRRVAELFARLAESSRRRGVRPASAPGAIAELFELDDPVVGVAALDLAGAWGDPSLAPAVARIARDGGQSLELRASACANLARIGGDLPQETLRELSSPASARSIRVAATRALAAVDPIAASQSAIDLLRAKEALSPSDIEVLVRSFLERKGGADTLAGAFEKLAGELDSDTAKLVLRAVRDSGLGLYELPSVVRRAGGLPEEPEPLASEARAEILAAFASSGDASRGERVFRRDDLRCTHCHALGGAGGRVGPDLSTIGASAQPDYILEAILDPPAAIKEGFHAAAVVTKAGEVFTGVRVRRGEDAIVLRLADDREVTIPASAIAEEAEAGSIMPAGLEDAMTRGELLDLLAFLTKLGKPGGLELGREPRLRSWLLLRTLPSAIASLPDDRRGRAVEALGASEWTRVPATVDGSLPIESEGREPMWARSAIELTSPGVVVLEVEAPAEARVWIDGRIAGNPGKVRIELERGRHPVLVETRPGEDPSSIRVTIAGAEGAASRTRPVLDP